jgi:hypothetical protein
LALAVALAIGCQVPATAAAQRAAVKFTIDSNDLVRLPVTLGDSVRRSLIFDTGASIDALAPSLIRALHGTPAGELDAPRMTGEILHIPLYRIDRVRVGDLELRDVLVGSVEILDQMGLPGIMSLNDFREQPVTLDFLHDELVPESPSSLERRKSAGVSIPIRSDDLRGEAVDLFADFSLAGVRGECVIDTGSQAPTLSTRLLGPLGIDSTGPGVRVRRGTTIGGATQVSYLTTIPSVALAEDTAIRQDRPRVIFSDIIYDCNVGLDWWKGKAMTIDLHAHRLVISTAGNASH